MTQEISPKPHHDDEAILVENQQQQLSEVNTPLADAQAEASAPEAVEVPAQANEVTHSRSRKGIAIGAAGALLAVVAGGAFLVGKGSSESAPEAGKQPVATAPAHSGHKHDTKPAKKASATPEVTTETVPVDPNVTANLQFYSSDTVRDDKTARETVGSAITSPLKPADFAPLIAHNQHNVNVDLAQQLKHRYPQNYKGTADQPGIEAYANVNDAMSGFLFNTIGNMWAEPAAIWNSLATESHAYNEDLKFYDPTSRELIGGPAVITKADVEEAAKSSDATELFKKMLPLQSGARQVSYWQIYANEVKAGNPDYGDALAKHLMTFTDVTQARSPEDPLDYSAELKTFHAIRDAVTQDPNNYGSLLQGEGIYLKNPAYVSHAEVLAVTSADPNMLNMDAHPPKTPVTMVSFEVQLKQTGYSGDLPPMLYTVALVPAPLNHKDPSTSQAIVLDRVQMPL